MKDAHESCRKKELAAYAKGLEEGKRIGKAEAYEEVLRAAEEEIPHEGGLWQTTRPN